MRTYEIAAVHGDGISPEVCKAALEVVPAGDIDFVIVRENAEGLYAARGGGVVVLRDEMATDSSMGLTRKGTERVVRAVTACC